MNKIIYTLIGIFTVTVIIFMAAGGENSEKTTDSQESNVATVNGQQFIGILAKGGYSPQKTIAQANVPTTLRMKTKGTFDCSAAISIPSLGISKTLPFDGVTEITIPAQKSATKIQGLCAMGMYNFTIDFI